jgi:hypothetical protein
MAREGLNKVRLRPESRGFLARVKGRFAYLRSKKEPAISSERKRRGEANLPSTKKILSWDKTVRETQSPASLPSPEEE